MYEGESSIRERGIGDCRLASRHCTYRVWFDSESEAQRLADWVCDMMNWSPTWAVIFMKRRTKRLMGRANGRNRTVRLYPKGQTVGTLLHELAHTKGYRHDGEFKATQDHLIRMWMHHKLPIFKMQLNVERRKAREGRRWKEAASRSQGLLDEMKAIRKRWEGGDNGKVVREV